MAYILILVIGTATHLYSLNRYLITYKFGGLKWVVSQELAAGICPVFT